MLWCAAVWSPRLPRLPAPTQHDVLWSLAEAQTSTAFETEDTRKRPTSTEIRLRGGRRRRQYIGPKQVRDTSPPFGKRQAPGLSPKLGLALDLRLPCVKRRACSLTARPASLNLDRLKVGPSSVTQTESGAQAHTSEPVSYPSWALSPQAALRHRPGPVRPVCFALCAPGLTPLIRILAVLSDFRGCARLQSITTRKTF